MALLWHALIANNYESSAIKLTEALRRLKAGIACAPALLTQDGMDKWAAFFETRRYAALKGATTEFSKWEGLTFSPSHSKIYTSMTDSESRVPWAVWAAALW